MDDLISREAVIDGIEELKKSPWANDSRNGYEYLISEALGTVKDLCVKDCPSAFNGMTNGEVLKSIFPTAELILGNSDYIPNVFSIKEDWWNAPYKAERW